ncbi:hypothetical protein [Bradyrhizobium icense]|uniref:hypothetical protein n=1 Tax=Bradyrhizobium icense TaxID=1274631 RepID=UPI0012EA10AE|nr:hypothetical protein [Bradyrhizobium icense]
MAEADRGAFIVFHRHFNANAFAIDAATETNFAASVFGDNVIAIAWNRNCPRGGDI